MNFKKYTVSSIAIAILSLGFQPLLRSDDEATMSPRQFLIEVKKDVHNDKVFAYAKKQIEERDLRRSQNRAIANSVDHKEINSDDIQVNVLLKVYENHLSEEKQLSADESALLKRLNQK